MASQPGRTWCFCVAVLAVVLALAAPASASLLGVAPEEHHDAQCMSELLAPALVRVGRHAPQLYVFGSPAWLGPFLGLTKNAATVLLVDSFTVPPFGNVPFPAASAIVLVAESEPTALVPVLQALDKAPVYRILLWTKAPATGAEVMEQIAVASNWYHKSQLRFVFADDANSSTLVRLSTAVSLNASQHHKAGLTTVDTWTPGKRWGRGVAAAFLPCFYRGSASAPVRVVKFNARRDGDLYYETWSQYSSVILRDLFKGVRVQTEYVDVKTFWERYFRCSFDVLYGAEPMPAQHATLFSVYPWLMDTVVAVVPRKMTMGDCLVDGVTSEFTGALWLTTALFLCGVLATALVAGGRDATFLDALAPLVAQGPRERGTAAWRAVMGAWLLTSVVLSAAYTGTLLSQVQLRCSRNHIETVEELVASGLPIYMQGQIRPDTHPLLQKSLPLGRIQLLRGPDFALVVPKLLQNGSAGVIVTRSLLKYIKPRLLPVLERLYEFPIHSGYAPSIFLTAKGFPHEESLRHILRRLLNSGLGPSVVSRFQLRNDPRMHAVNRAVRWEQPKHKALSLFKIRAAFVVLGVGYLAATVAFLAEKCLFRVLEARKAPKLGRRRTAWT